MQGKSIGRARSPEHAALGRTVRRIRAWRGISQEELGARAGLHRNYIGAIERGEINATFKTLMRLSGGLAVPLSALVQLYERNIGALDGSGSV